MKTAIKLIKSFFNAVLLAATSILLTATIILASLMVLDMTGVYQVPKPTTAVRYIPNATIIRNNFGFRSYNQGDSTNFTITVSKTLGQSFKVHYLIGSTLDSLVGTGDGVYTINTGNLSSTTDITLIDIQVSSTQQLTGTITIPVK